MLKNRFVFLLPLWGMAVACVVSLAEESARDVRVMSFNIRYGTANDGQNSWEHRKEFLIETIQAFHPDLLGTQETLGFQRDYLAQALVDFDYLGVGRNDGREEGEMMALYYRRERFEKLDDGHFWLSEMPEEVGSKSWDSSLPRMVTWVKLRDLHQENSRPILYYNTHFDHQGTRARLESAKLLRDRMEKVAQEVSLIVTGDFNTGEGSPPYRALFDVLADHASPVVDTYHVLHPSTPGRDGTFSGFKAESRSGARIDWIGASRDWSVQEAAIDYTSRDGRTPSDHFAVTAVLRR